MGRTSTAVRSRGNTALFDPSLSRQLYLEFVHVLVPIVSRFLSNSR